MILLCFFEFPLSGYQRGNTGFDCFCQLRDEGIVLEGCLK